MSQQRKSRPSPKMIARAREFRRVMTPAGELLWKALRSRGLGVKFSRQRPIGRFIVDFYCDEARLVVELDSEAHAEPPQAEQDRERDMWFEARGYRVVRFTNTLVQEKVEWVLDRLRRAIDEWS